MQQRSYSVSSADQWSEATVIANSAISSGKRGRSPPDPWPPRGPRCEPGPGCGALTGLALRASPVARPREQGACHLSSAERLVLDRGFTRILPCGPAGQGGAGCLPGVGSEAAHPRSRDREAGNNAEPVSRSRFPGGHAHTSTSGAHVTSSRGVCLCFFHPRKTQFILLISFPKFPMHLLNLESSPVTPFR